MRIDGTIPYFNSFQTTVRKIPEAAQPQQMNYNGQGVTLEISRQAWDAYNQSKAALEKVKSNEAIQELEGCRVCDNRKYVDVSNDSSVSFQSPQHISPEQSAGRVMAHEREHVSNEQVKAQKNDRKVVSQSVLLSTSICEECGKVYVSGGVTRTITKSNDQGNNQDGMQEMNDTGQNDA